MLTNNTFYCTIGEVGKSHQRGNVKGLTPVLVIRYQKEWQSAISGQLSANIGIGVFLIGRFPPPTEEASSYRRRKNRE